MRMTNTESSGGEWALLPEGVYVMAITAIDAAEPSARFPDTKRVSIRYEVPESARAAIVSDLEEDQQQSYRLFEYTGQTLGTEGKRSRLFSRLATAVGPRGVKVLDQWLGAHGEIDLEWFVDMTVRVSVIHQEGTNGRTYANVGATIPVDDPGPNLQRLLAVMAEDSPDLYASVIAPLLTPAKAAPVAAASSTKSPTRLSVVGATPVPATLPWD